LNCWFTYRLRKWGVNSQSSFGNERILARSIRISSRAIVPLRDGNCLISFTSESILKFNRIHYNLFVWMFDYNFYSIFKSNYNFWSRGIKEKASQSTITNGFPRSSRIVNRCMCWKTAPFMWLMLLLLRYLLIMRKRWYYKMIN